MTEEEIVEELLRRVKELAKIKTEPLQINDPAETGKRDFNFNNLWFKIEFYAPRHWSFSGPKRGDIKCLGIYVAGTLSNPPFWFNREANGADELMWQFDKSDGEGIILSLRSSMILDDLAGIETDA